MSCCATASARARRCRASLALPTHARRRQRLLAGHLRTPAPRHRQQGATLRCAMPERAAIRSLQMALAASSGPRRCSLIPPSFRSLHLPPASASPHRAFSHHRILSPSDTAAYLASSLLPSSRSPAPPRSVSTTRHTLVQTRPPWTGPCATTCSLRLQLTSLAALLRSPLLPLHTLVQPRLGVCSVILRRAAPCHNPCSSTRSSPTPLHPTSLRSLL